MGFVKVGKILPQVAELSEEAKAMEAAYVVEMVNKHTGEIFGEKAIGNVKALRFKGEVLIIGVVSSVWSHEIRLSKARVIDSINDFLTDKKVAKLRYQIT